MSEDTVISNDATRKHPTQGKFKSGIKDKKTTMRVDVNRHGIRRETNIQPKRTGRKKV